MDSGIILAIVGLIILGLIFFVINKFKVKIIAFFDDVVKEMKKVTWPTIAELKESTTVVIVSCLMLAAFTYVIDMVITQIFKGIF
jgi:preprotein translocase subunit SecE